MFKKILLNLQKYFLVKNPFKSINNNTLIILARLRNSKITINGKKNIIDISQGDFKRIKVGVHGNNNEIHIGNATNIRNLEIILQGDNHKLYIGNKTEIGGASIVCCGNSTEIVIGNECMLASNIYLKSCDGHSIYQTNRVINPSKNIFIGNHVWIAQNVFILKGVTLGNDTVVGINTLVTSGKFESNVVLGGSPAKILKKNITWGKENIG